MGCLVMLMVALGRGALIVIFSCIDMLLVAMRVGWRILEACAPALLQRANSIVRRASLDPRDRASLETLQDGARSRVVIIGGSFSALAAARTLRDDFDVTIVDFKEYFEYTPGILRCYCTPGYLKVLTCALPTYHHEVVVAEVLEVTPSHLRVEYTAGNEGILEYDYLLIGAGSSYPQPEIKPSAAEPRLEDRQATWDAAAKQLRAAETVLILGGGPVGVELAAEVVSHYPPSKKRVTMLWGGRSLCASLPPRVGQLCEDFLRERGCELRSGCRATELVLGASGAPSGCVLEDGTTLSADVVYDCRGGVPAGWSLGGTALGSRLDASGALLVQETLQLDGSPRIYAMGDAMSLRGCDDTKLGHTAELNAALAAANVRRQSRGEELLSYPRGIVGMDRTPQIYAISLGMFDGVIAFNGVVLGGGGLCGALAACIKFGLEWSKVAQAEERLVGHAFWHLADVMSCLISRWVLPPPHPPPPPPPHQQVEEGGGTRAPGAAASERLAMARAQHERQHASRRKLEVRYAEPPGDDSFLPASTFGGARPGYVYTTRQYGPGYYPDVSRT